MSCLSVGVSLGVKEIKSRMRKPQDVLNLLIFFLLVTCLYPLVISTNAKTMPLMGVGVIWVSVLLSVVLGLDQLFKVDFETGMLENYLFSAYPLPFLMFSKILAHWILQVAPLILLAPLVGILFALSWHAVAILLLTLVIGSLLLTFVGAMIAALTISLVGSGAALLFLILTPLYIPVLLLSVSVIQAAIAGLAWLSPLLFLTAMLVLAVTFSPFVCGFGLRLSLQY